MDQAVEAGSVVAVTGASGFVGRYVVRELARLAGSAVRGLVRDRQKAREVLPLGGSGGHGSVTVVEEGVLDQRVMDEVDDGPGRG